MLGVDADYHYSALALNNLALLAHRLDGWPYFHFDILPSAGSPAQFICFAM